MPMTDDEFLNKVQWEGGVIGALEYGLRADELEDKKGELYKLWSKLEKSWKALLPKLSAVEAYVEEQEDYDVGYDEDDEGDE